MQDDVEQAAAASRLIESFSEEAPGFVPIVALVELVWVLGSAYRLRREQVADAVEALLRTKEIVVDHAELVWMALRVFRRAKSDFADCLIERIAFTSGCNRTVTFDLAAAKLTGMQLLT
jgi:predicted nucleic-acid-binding protein